MMHISITDHVAFLDAQNNPISLRIFNYKKIQTALAKKINDLAAARIHFSLDGSTAPQNVLHRLQKAKRIDMLANRIRVIVDSKEIYKGFIGCIVKIWDALFRIDRFKDYRLLQKKAETYVADIVEKIKTPFVELGKNKSSLEQERIHLEKQIKDIIEQNNKKMCDLITDRPMDYKRLLIKRQEFGNAIQQFRAIRQNLINKLDAFISSCCTDNVTLSDCTAFMNFLVETEETADPQREKLNAYAQEFGLKVTFDDLFGC